MKRRSYAAPVIVAVLLLLYYVGMAILFFTIPGILWWIRLLLCLIPAAVGALILFVTIQRIREIRSGETDDLDKY